MQVTNALHVALAWHCVSALAQALLSANLRHWLQFLVSLGVAQNWVAQFALLPQLADSQTHGPMMLVAVAYPLATALTQQLKQASTVPWIQHCG
jgi:hypothetical protein